MSLGKDTDATKADVEPVRRPEALSSNERLTLCLQAVMAELADLLESDQFNRIEAIVLRAGVPYPPLGTDPRTQLPPETKAEHPDEARLDLIAAEYLHLIPFDMPTGQGDADVGWRALQSHMGKPEGVEIACVYRDDIREAIDMARRALKSNGVDSVPSVAGGLPTEPSTSRSACEGSGPAAGGVVSGNCEHGLPRRFCTAVHEGDPK